MAAEEVASHAGTDLVNSADDVLESHSEVITPEESAEIVLFVEDGKSDVEDLIRVALSRTAGAQLVVPNSSGSTLPAIAGSAVVCCVSDGVATSESDDIVDAEDVSIKCVGETFVGRARPDSNESEELDNKNKGSIIETLFQLANLRGIYGGESNCDENEADVSTDAEGNLVIHTTVECVEDVVSSKACDERTHFSNSQCVIADEKEIVKLEYLHADTANAQSIPREPGNVGIGDEFFSLDALEAHLQLYEEKHKVKLWKKDVRSLDACLRRSMKLSKLSAINFGLKYGQLLYCCSYGGKRKAQKFATRDESGLSRYTDCKMHIRFAISDDGKKLVVIGMNEEHCHDEILEDQDELDKPLVTNEGNAEEIRLGAGFVDMDALYKAIHKYETDNHVHLWRRDGRTVEALAKRAPGTARKVLNNNPNLKFAELRLCCSYGGRPNEDRKEKLRNSTSSKQGCGMHIRFGLSDDGSQLVVKSISEEHNHEISFDSIVKESLHPELCSYISNLVWNDGNITMDHVKAELDRYVTEVMFMGQNPPPRTRRQYFPSKKQIRYFMGKARSALSIGAEHERDLEEQAECYKEKHADEKLLYNFRVKQGDLITMTSELSVSSHDDSADIIDDPFLGNPGSPANKDVPKVLYCHQTPHQQRLLKRYGQQLFVTEIKDIRSKIPFPLFALFVQTNVDYQLVGMFLLYCNQREMIAEGLNTIKEWNPGVSPKYVVCDFMEDQIIAMESAFPSSFVLISDLSRINEWSVWLETADNGLRESKDDVMAYLQAIAGSYSEDTLNAAARALEESDVWKDSEKLRNWFQTNWLSQAKRWVQGYRPDDYLLLTHTGHTLEDELKVFRSIKVVNRSLPLHDVIQQLVDVVVPKFAKQYASLNEEVFKLQKGMFYMHESIPRYLVNLPGKLILHVYEHMQQAAEQRLQAIYIHPGVFSVEALPPGDESQHTVSFGDAASFPSCDCQEWQNSKLPCVHMCTVFNSTPGWSWDMLSVLYRAHPVLNIDWCSLDGLGRQSTLVDISTQTVSAPAPLVEDFKSQGHLLRETPQVLATQCKSLLQQLGKLHLVHHGREKLQRLKSDLKDMITMFNGSPDKANSLTNLLGTRCGGVAKGGVETPGKSAVALDALKVQVGSSRNLQLYDVLLAPAASTPEASATEEESAKVGISESLVTSSMNSVIGKEYEVKKYPLRRNKVVSPQFASTNEPSPIRVISPSKLTVKMENIVAGAATEKRLGSARIRAKRAMVQPPTDGPVHKQLRSGVDSSTIFAKHSEDIAGQCDLPTTD